ncbi:MAG: hemolysin family protein [Flavobacteriales bacterium]
MELNLLLITASLICSAFFSAMELAYISANRLRIEVIKKNNTFQAKILHLFYRKESNMIALLLLGNNVALVVYGLAAGAELSPFLQQMGIQDQGLILVLQTVLSTLLVLITAEFLPKALVQLNPNKALDLGLYILWILYILLYLPTQLIVLISNGFLKLFGAQKEEQRVFTKVDLENYVDELSAKLSDEEELGNDMVILRNALDFSNVKARDCMIPRPEIIAVDIQDSIEDAQALMTSKGLSKLIIYRDDIDNIIGYIHSFDLFKQPASIKQILKPISFVPTVISGKELLKKFTNQAGNFAVVTDEYGGTAGIITLEDVIEEIFGEIEDEHDKEALTEQEVSSGEFLFSARITIDYLNENYSFQLPESESYETLAGLVLAELERLPSEGDEVELKGVKLLVEKMSERKIETIRLYVKQD